MEVVYGIGDGDEEGREREKHQYRHSQQCSGGIRKKRIKKGRYKRENSCSQHSYERARWRKGKG